MLTLGRAASGSNSRRAMLIEKAMASRFAAAMSDALSEQGKASQSDGHHDDWAVLAAFPARSLGFLLGGRSRGSRLLEESAM